MRGPEGPAGPAGPEGPAGAGSTAEIVVVDTSYDATVGYVPSLMVVGSGFEPGDSVHLTICDEDYVLAEDIEVNDCGAFSEAVSLPTPSLPVVSLKAYVDDGDGEFDSGDELMACWPLIVGP